MYPDNKATCWADTAYQTCGGRQEAYDALMMMGGSNTVSAVLHNALNITQCSIIDDEPETVTNPPTAAEYNATDTGYYNEKGEYCDQYGCYPPATANTGYINEQGEYCDEYGCYPNPGATTATGGYTDPYCASNGYCNNTMTYYNEKGDYCDIANCYTDSGVVPNINDACDEFGCYNYTQGDIPVTANEDIRATVYNETNTTNSTTGPARYPTPATTYNETNTTNSTTGPPPATTTTGPPPATTTGGSTYKPTKLSKEDWEDNTCNKYAPSWD